ncbi:hypothetical protein EJ05DRAFT_241542 [Pseudovirgaria hyperparasitica]|uniref:F-box domain-containing protein n=1 Tax=Pseudovirgaria hyperparasitica TaxID=470096 RepID=A0A6A6WFR9_9PEZI|nr:uncharacterized protein EJ05DRAFT_241542 [Pseudovirgaria hyperparasitica]KAF2760756.1 hypothetical protein EJ05DRAFT_241542 [Pseudovirgaria hyperparasitica]
MADGDGKDGTTAPSLHASSTPQQHLNSTIMPNDNNEQSALLTLPSEILIHIFDLIDERNTLLNASNTCTRLRKFAQEHIYRDVLIRTGQAARRMNRDLANNPIRTRNIRRLAIRYLAEDQDGIEDINPRIREMKHLRHLFIETPCCNDIQWRPHLEGQREWAEKGRIDVTDLFRNATLLRDPAHRSLAFLKSFTYHSHGLGNAKYAFPDHSVFHHPTLETIKLSCLDFTPDPSTTTTTTPNHTTSLRTLIFDECNISAPALLTTLRLPRALQTLTLGERKHHFHDSPIPLLASSLSTLLAALALQSHALTSLSHDGGSPHIFDSAATPSSFRNALPSLHTLVIGPASFLHRYLQAEAHPPRLRALALSGIQTHHLEYLEQILERYLATWLPAPRFGSDTAMPTPMPYALDIHMRPTKDVDTIEDAVALLWRSPSRCLGTRSFGESMARRGCRVRVWASLWGNFIPPYMYGEQEPVEVVAYDSMAASARSGVGVGEEDVVEMEERERERESNGSNGSGGGGGEEGRWRM